MKAGPRAGDLSSERRRRLTHRALPALCGLAVVSLAAGMAFGSAAPSGRGADRGGLRRRLGAAATTARCTRCSTTRRARPIRCPSSSAPTATPRPLPPPPRSRRATQAGSRTARSTCRSMCARGSSAPSPPTWCCPVSEAGVTWGPLLAFPGLRRGEALTRRSEPPERATLLSRDGKVLAEGPAGARSSPLGGDRRVDRRDAGARGDPRGAHRPLRARLPARLAGGPERARARLRGSAGRAPGRRAAGRGAGARPCPPEARATGAHHDRHAPAGGGRDRRWPGASAASPRSTPATGRSGRWPGSRSPPRSRRARPSRS